MVFDNGGNVYIFIFMCGYFLYMLIVLGVLSFVILFLYNV